MSRARNLARTVVPSGLRRNLRHLEHRAQMVHYYDGLRRKPVQSLRYLIADQEMDNFTYDIENIDELTGALANILGEDRTVVAGYIDELREDRGLHEAVEHALEGRSDRNNRMPFGRRLGWYAVARIRKPGIIFETGVHDGLGSIALLRALQRNAEDGQDGQLVGFDINPDAGWLIPADLKSRYRIVIGDSLASLPRELEGHSVELFVHDSDHRYEHEMGEWQIARPHMAAGSVLLSDNAHAVTAFDDFCRANGLDAHLWREVPHDHFYPGAGIGLAVAPGGWSLDTS